METLRPGHTEGGHSYMGGDPSDPINWKKIGATEDGYVFKGGDPAFKDNWEPAINPEDEADLGFVNRAKYAIEPIQSNRKALLLQAFGEENVMQNEKGDLFIKQGEKFLPVDKEGFSAANAADILGATPEIAGNVAGFVAGGVPGAMATGAAGSLARQGLSAVIGTPQVATPEERAIETGSSALLSAGGQLLGQVAKPYVQGAKRGITEIIKNLRSPIQEATESTVKTVGKSTMDMAGELIPEVAQKTEQSIMGKVADESGREAVMAERKALESIAERQGLPKPTYAQAAQGKAIIAESELLDTPLISGKIRKTVDEQLKGIKNNLEKITGKFIDVDSSAPEVGATTKELIETGIDATKKISQELYAHVDEIGKDAVIGRKPFFNRLRDFAGEHGLIDPLGNKMPFSADSGYTRKEFDAIQNAVFDAIDAVKKTPAEKVRFDAVHGLMKTIKGTAEELSESSPNASRIVSKLGDQLEEVAERTLDREAPGLSESFKEARKNWRSYKTQQKAYKQLLRGGQTNDESVVRTIMAGTTNLRAAKEILGEDRVKEIGISFLRDKLAPLGKSGIGRADSVLSELKKPSVMAPLKEAIGEDAYRNVIENLHFLNRTGQPLHVSRQSLLKLFTEDGGIKKIGVKLTGAGRNYAVSKGGTKAVKEAVVETTGKVVDSGSSPKTLSSLFNLGTDEMQRNFSAIPSLPSPTISESEKRKRAISGGKQ